MTTLETGGRTASAQTLDGSDTETAWKRASQTATIGIFVIGLMWVMYAAQHVIIPVALAWVIATIVLPVVRGLEKLYIPRLIGAIAVTVLLLLLIALLIVLLSAPVAYWLGRAGQFAALLREKLQSLSQPLALLQELRAGLDAINPDGSRPLRVESPSSNIVSTFLSVVTPAISQFVLFIGSFAFYLVYQQKVRSTLVYLMPDRQARLTMLRTLNDIDDNMTKYFGTFTIINICLGAVTTGLAWMVGFPNPLLWGVLAAVLNYVPYLGPGTGR